MKQTAKRIKSIFGSSFEIFFENGSPNPAGDILNSGIGLPTHRSYWWDTRKMWDIPTYSLSMMLGDGKGSYRNENGFQCELSHGTFYFLFPDFKQHCSPIVGEHWGELYVSFAGTIFEAVKNQHILTPEKPVWSLPQPEPWIERLQLMMQMPAPMTAMGNLRRAVQFLDYLLEMMEQASPLQTNEPTGDWFTKACKMLTDDLHHTVDLQHIASELGMGYHTFRIYFTRRAGMPPIHYRDQVRIEAACDSLINNTHKSCKEIAFILGYSSLQQFSKQFKKQTGFSPNHYRQKTDSSSRAA